jgi:hypothetical protein
MAMLFAPFRRRRLRARCRWRWKRRNISIGPVSVRRLVRLLR